MTRSRRSIIKAAGAASLAAGFLFFAPASRGLAASGPLPAPSGKAILTVTGKIAVTNKSGAAEFDRPMLEGLGLSTVVTETPWYKGPTTFEGVSIAKLLAAVGASGTRLVAIALNDYSAEVPVEDIEKYNVILALKRDGEYMPIRDKGPLFIVYPFDANPELKAQKFYSRSVWQVAKIEVK